MLLHCCQSLMLNLKRINWLFFWMLRKCHWPICLLPSSYYDDESTRVGWKNKIKSKCLLLEDMKITICLVKVIYRFCVLPIVYPEGFLHASICLLVHLFSCIMLDLVVFSLFIPGFAQMNMAIEIACRSGMSIIDFLIFSTLFLVTQTLFWISKFQFCSNLK